MSAVSRDKDMIARSQVHAGRLAFKQQLRFALENDHPFVLVLFVPKVFRAAVAVGDDALDAHVLALRKDRDEFVGESAGQIGKEVVHLCCTSVVAKRPRARHQHRVRVRAVDCGTFAPVHFALNLLQKEQICGESALRDGIEIDEPIHQTLPARGLTQALNDDANKHDTHAAHWRRLLLRR